jgi:hypothetical protein
MLLLVGLVAAAPIALALDAGQERDATELGAIEDARRAHEQAQRQARVARQRIEHRFADYEYGLVRTGILAVGLGLFAWGLRQRPRATGRAARVRVVLLVLTGVVAYGSYYQFFQLLHAKGFRTTDNFHYYVGSKYFAELGYFGLYECGLHALQEHGQRALAPLLTARRLTDMQLVPMSEILEAGAACPARFSPERWEEFGSDVVYFVESWPQWKYEAVWDDHGYHPSPIWSLLGGAIAERMPTSEASNTRFLARIDRWFVAAGLLAIGWAFGVEAAALAAIVWGTGHLWRYAFVGDAFLRHLWWASAIFGVCMLRRGWHAWSGGLLAFSSLLRIFPGAFPLAFGLGAARRLWQDRRLPDGAIGFAAGGLATGIALIGLTAAASGRGIEVFAEFADKISLFAAIPAANKMGLGVLAQWIFGPDALAGSACVLALRLVFLALFWRALARARDWETAALGCALIPILTDPTNYYYSFVVLAACLAVRRPRIGLWLGAAALLWNLNGLINYRTYVEYAYASGIAVLFALATVLEMGRAPADAEAPDAGASGAGPRAAAR